MTAGYRLRLSRDKNRRIPGKTVSLSEDRDSRIPSKTLYLFRDRDRRIQVKDCIPPIHPHTIRVSVTQVLLFPWNTVIALSLYPAVCSSNGCRIAFRGGGTANQIPTEIMAPITHHSWGGGRRHHVMNVMMRMYRIHGEDIRPDSWAI